MDLTFTEAEEAFRHEIRSWLEQHVPSTPLTSMDTADGFEQHREWEKELHADRWSVVSWPEKYGGRDCTLIEWLIFEEEYYRSGAPGRVSANGVTLLGPTIFGFGTEEQKDRFLPKMASGEEIWAQGWSEPNAGSDLAGLKTKAIRDGDHFVVNGQKTWCSRGAFADWIFCIFRTDPEAQRHKGLTYFLVPGDLPGMERNPVGRLDGEPGFAELFFEDARVHESAILGGEGQGWNVAMATASSERGLNLRSPGRFMAPAERAVALYQRLSAERDDRRHDIDPGLRDQVVRNWMNAQAYRWYTYLTAARLMGGGHMGPEASLMKVFWSEMDVEIHATALRMAGAEGELMGTAPDALDGGGWMDGYQFALSGPIYAGTNEIQRNIIAERVLGLPAVRTTDMHFAFTEDQFLFRDTVRDLLANECKPEDVRAAWGNDTGRVPGLWDKLVEMGVAALTAPEAAGGLGMTEIDLVLLQEEAGRAALPDVLIEHTAVGVPLLAELGETTWLAKAAAGEAVIGVGIGSPYVLYADQCDVLLLVHDDELHAVPTAEVTLTPQRSVDYSRRLSSIAWLPSAATLVAKGDGARQALLDGCDRGALAAAAQCVGIAQTLIDVTVDYVGQREQFGKIVGSYQAVKHQIANALLAVEFARPLVYVGAYALANTTPHRAREVSMAKAAASDAVDRAARTALQCHGAIGYTFEYDLHLWMKRGWALAAAWGDAAFHRDRVARDLGI